MSTDIPEQNVAQYALSTAALTFLRRYPPFDEIEHDVLASVVPRLSLGYYCKDTIILQPADGTPGFLYIVQRGRVAVRPFPAGASVEATIAELGPGECFSVSALLDKRAVSPAYVAATDVFCYQLTADDFQVLLTRSARFRDFATSYLSSLLRDSRRLLKMHASGYAGEETMANRPLRSLIARTPVCCKPDTPIEVALRAMHREQVGSIVVVDETGALMGILTRHDVLERIALARRNLNEPVSAVMTARPKTLQADASAYDAALLIAHEGIRHVPVMENGRVLGVVTERDLFALQRSNMRSIRRAIFGAEDVPGMQNAARDIRSLARMLLEQGLAAEQLTFIVSTLNDALTERVIQLAIGRHPLPDIEWAWLAFGSEGRYEQTISTDQDNGLVFGDHAGISADAQRQRILPFARSVNETLDACGFPLCKGNIMASNPLWCLGVGEWQAKFAHWVQHTDAKELLNSVIFFDMRPIYGAHRLTTPLIRKRDALIGERPVFLRQLAGYALESRPPLGVLGGFAADDPRAPGMIDLKKSGARIFTDAGRVLAFAAGVGHTNTAQRLRLSGGKLGMSHDEIESATEAFFFIQSLRLRSQLAGSGDIAAAAPNHIDPRKLNEVDRRMLKEAFHQARKLQSRLALDYQL
jgi:CBS domain-containing protein